MSPRIREDNGGGERKTGDHKGRPYGRGAGMIIGGADGSRTVRTDWSREQGMGPRMRRPLHNY